MKKKISDSLAKELEARERLGKLIDNPYITGFVPKDLDSEIKVNTMNNKTKKLDKTVLTGKKAIELNTPDKIFDYLESKYVPEVFGDKVLLYIFPEDLTEDVALTEKGLMIHHDDTKQIKFRRMGDKEQTEERLTQLGLVIGAGSGLVTDTGSVVTMHVKKGDLVYVGYHAGGEIMYDGVGYKILREYDIICKLPKKL